MKAAKVMKRTVIRRFLTVLTALAVIACVAVVGFAMGENRGIKITSFLLEDPVGKISAPVGTERAALELPKTLLANIVRDGAEEMAEVPVQWVDNGMYDATAPGTYIFTAVLDGYSYPQAAPFIEVTLAKAEQTAPAQLWFTQTPAPYEISRGTTLAQICEALPKTAAAVDKDAKPLAVAVTWAFEMDDFAKTMWDTPEEAFSDLSARGYGPWKFVASVDKAYRFDGEPPSVEVHVKDCSEIDYLYPSNEAVSHMKYETFVGDKTFMMAPIVNARMKDGGDKTVPLDWKGSFDLEKEGVYTMEAFVYGVKITAEVTVMERWEGE